MILIYLKRRIRHFWKIDKKLSFLLTIFIYVAKMTPVNNKNYNYKITYLDEVDSTNTYLKRLAAEAGAEEGTVVVASRQTGGRGRMGKSFFSPDDTGLYMSILLKPDIQASEAVSITAAAAVAVARAIEELTDIAAQIKWVNDIYISGRKVCGILTEASFNSGSKKPDYAVLGIGVNIFPPEGGFPQDIAGKAGFVFPCRKAGAKENLMEAILQEFNILYKNIEDKTFTEEYRSRSCVIGKDVTVVCGNHSYPATVLDITSDCKLKTALPDGSVQYLSSGEIFIKGDFS